MKTTLVAFMSLVAASTLVQAGPIAAFDQLRVFRHSEPERRLIQYGEDTPAKWMEQTDIDNLFRAGVKFMDITDHQDLGAYSAFHSAWQPGKRGKKRKASCLLG
jgi:leucyl aminopeptidase